MKRDYHQNPLQRVYKRTQAVARRMAKREGVEVPQVIHESIIERAIRTSVPVTLKYRPAKRKT